MKVGPALNGLAKRRSRDWIEMQIRHPERHVAETMMPAYDLTPQDMDRLIAYLLSLPYVEPFSVARIDGLEFLGYKAGKAERIGSGAGQQLR
jgi:hypothetical protein